MVPDGAVPKAFSEAGQISKTSQDLQKDPTGPMKSEVSQGSFSSLIDYHPIIGGSNHYKDGSIQPLNLIESQRLDFHIGNVIKYAVRANHYYYSQSEGRPVDEYRLNEIGESIDKAIWYLERFKVIHHIV